VDKLIGKIEKLTTGEHPSNAYVVVSIGEHTSIVHTLTALSGSKTCLGEEYAAEAASLSE